MYDLPDQFCDLSPKRQRKLFELVTDERKDSALACVIIGLKCMHQVHHYGLERLCSLSKVWGTAITDFYKAGNDLYPGWDRCGTCGGLVTDPLEAFRDLSPRRLRQITDFIATSRLEAHGNAYRIGLDTMRRELGFGDLRIDRLESQWQADLRCFYEDRETAEPMLKDWIEEIGFIWEGGRLQSYLAKDNDKPIRKRTAERWMSEDDHS